MYNIEVEDDHVYRVGEQGILVHNMSTIILHTLAFPTSPSSCSDCLLRMMS
ncbi:MAG: hypothetical protein ACFCD0_25485 [Gemmataceae bacterium]